MLLLDVTPQNLGIMVVGGYFNTIIAKNTTVPTSQTHLFTTVQDDQSQVRIAIMQGESEKAVENELLGEFILDDIRPAKRGEVSIEVTFDISADGIVGVAARDVQHRAAAVDHGDRHLRPHRGGAEGHHGGAHRRAPREEADARASSRSGSGG